LGRANKRQQNSDPGCDSSSNTDAALPSDSAELGNERPENTNLFSMLFMSELISSMLKSDLLFTAAEIKKTCSQKKWRVLSGPQSWL